MDGIVSDWFGKRYEIVSALGDSIPRQAQPLPLFDEEAALRFVRSLQLSNAQWLRLLTTLQSGPVLTSGDATHKQVALLLSWGRIRVYPCLPKISLSDGEWRYHFSKGTNPPAGATGGTRVAIKNKQEAEALLLRLRADEQACADILQQNGYQKAGRATSKEAVSDLLVREDISVHKTSSSSATKPKAQPEILPAQGPGNRPVPLAPKTEKPSNWFSLKLKDENEQLVAAGALDMKLTDGKQVKVAVHGGSHKTDNLPPGKCKIKCVDFGDESEAYIFEAMASE